MQELSSQNIYQLFIESCKKYPQRSAIFINGVSYSYAQFLNIVSNIKFQIKTQKNESGFIGVFTDEHINTYASVWAILSTASAYVPINKKHPVQRSKEIINDAGIKILLYAEESIAIEELKTQLKDKIRFIRTNTVYDEAIDYSLPDIQIENFAYLLFTSGSTGKAKGVPISHKNLMALAKAHLFHPKYNIKKEDRFLQMFELTFDFSVLPTLFPFCVGASVYVVPQKGILFMEVLKTLRDHRITKAYMVPSVIHYLSPYFNEISLPDIQWSLFCGEALYEKTALGWAQCTPNGKIINTYGPTEATVFMTEYFLNPNDIESYNGIVSIGKAVQGMKCKIMDRQLQKVEKGELYISGNQTATHYLNNVFRSTESFINLDDGNLYYRSGDICFENENGNLMYCGRADQQVKINGYRIELEEIEFHAKKYLGNGDLAAFTLKNKSGANVLCMAIARFETNENDLVQNLKKNLPLYMVPEKVFFLEKIPLNTNAKTDRIKLASLFTTLL